MKKKSSDSSKNILKKQLISGGVYIALSAVAVAVTVNTVMNMMPENNIPDLAESIEDMNFKLPSVPQYDMSVNPALPQVEEQHDTSVSRTPSGVTAEIEETPDVQFSAIPSIPEIPAVTEGVADTADISEVSQNDTDTSLDTAVDTQADDIFIKPCEGFVTVEHSNGIPVYSSTFSDYRTHIGVDIAADKNCLVKAVKSGTVTEIYTDPLYGNTVKLQTPDGYCFVYSNLDEDFPEGITAGAEISIGTVIASVGGSAICETSQESHLHFEAYLDSKPVDPCSIIDF